MIGPRRARVSPRFSLEAGCRDAARVAIASVELELPRH